MIKSIVVITCMMFTGALVADYVGGGWGAFAGLLVVIGLLGIRDHLQEGMRYP